MMKVGEPEVNMPEKKTWLVFLATLVVFGRIKGGMFFL